ncbi:hypothetical protein ACLI1A_01965 [Flavobacterium sp. RHBU_3]|uniref:hypothetical protein n=1 Tax=Flavobacterium sp. RHBU_3 TaxID=3391184 RepID=UPI0039846673
MKVLLFSILVLISANYNPPPLGQDCDKLAVCLRSKEFQEFIHCDEIIDTEVVLYDNTGLFNNCDALNINGKIFKIRVPDFKVGVNETVIKGANKIVLFKAEKLKKATNFSFFLSITNANITLEVSDKNKIKVISRGVF